MVLQKRVVSNEIKKAMDDDEDDCRCLKVLSQCHQSLYNNLFQIGQRAGRYLNWIFKSQLDTFSIKVNTENEAAISWECLRSIKIKPILKSAFRLLLCCQILMLELLYFFGKNT